MKAFILQNEKGQNVHTMNGFEQIYSRYRIIFKLF